MRVFERVFSPVAMALALLVCVSPSGLEAEGEADTATALVGEVLAVRSDTGKITEVRLRRADGRYLMVELDAYGALLGVKHSGSFARVEGHVYLKLTGTLQVRWIRVKRFHVVPRPGDWVEPELVCHEVEDEPDALEEEPEADAGVEEELEE